MENSFKNLKIRNFKSIKSLDLQGCSRINLFIGRPNVGKSNILEALSLFSLPHVKFNTSKKLGNFIRVANISELFFDGNINEPISVNSEFLNAYVNFFSTNITAADLGVPYTQEHKLSGWNFYITQGTNLLAHLTLDETNSLKIYKSEFDSFQVKKYTFIPNVEYNQATLHYLIPPYGVNLLNSIEINSDLKSALINIFREYGLLLVFDRASQSLKIMKEKRGEEVFLIPYHSIADTLQRIIFYKTAIASNQNSVLLFEEPEAHSYPPYMAHLTQEIIHSKTNQFFITTHSPFILNDFLENGRDDLSVFVVNYADGQTVAKKLTSIQLDEIFQYGVDLFTNIESYY